MKVNREDRAGLYMTVIVHLAVIIVLLVSQIGFSLQKENSFVLDFTKQEQTEKQKAEEDFKDDISKRIDDLLAASEGGYIPLRNVSVNRGALKDDRGTDAEQLYKDAERLQKDLNAGVQENSDDSFIDYTPEKKTENKKEASYSGPSVLSWELDGRKASRLPIPAYRCLGGGMATVIITVDPQGNVVNAKIQDELSSQDQCLRNFAVRAARMSKFSASNTAPARQTGNIVYQFIAQ